MNNKKNQKLLEYRNDLENIEKNYEEIEKDLEVLFVLRERKNMDLKNSKEKIELLKKDKSNIKVKRKLIIKNELLSFLLLEIILLIFSFFFSHFNLLAFTLVSLFAHEIIGIKQILKKVFLRAKADDKKISDTIIQIESEEKEIKNLENKTELLLQKRSDYINLIRQLESVLFIYSLSPKKLNDITEEENCKIKTLALKKDSYF